MGDARARLPDRARAVDLFIDFKQRVHRSIANRMRGELQPALDRGFHNGPETVLGNEEHAAIRRIGDRIRLAHAPRLAHVRAARQHSAVEKSLDADNPQSRIGLTQRVLRHLANPVLDFFERANRIDVV